MSIFFFSLIAYSLALPVTSRLWSEVEATFFDYVGRVVCGVFRFLFACAVHFSRWRIGQHLQGKLIHKVVINSVRDFHHQPEEVLNEWLVTMGEKIQVRETLMLA